MQLLIDGSGNLPAHSGLWDSAKATAENIMARLAIEHIVHEGRGLDVTPSTIQKLRDAGDNESAEMLEAILQVLPASLHCLGYGCQPFELSILQKN